MSSWITAEDLRMATAGLVQPRRWWATLRHPVRTIREAIGDGPLLPLLVLFGLNATDELDRTAFGILLPDIRDHFGLSNSQILSVVALTALGALLLQLPIAALADRSNRVRMALLGAVAWSLFSVATGMAATVWFLIVARSGAGIGRAVVDPTHNPLLSDYYAVGHRVRVLSFHRAANALGQFVGPLLAGLLATWFSWRAPFLVFAVPTLLIVLVGLRMHEPRRGVHERIAAGASVEEAQQEEPPLSFAHAWRTVWRIEVLRRLWFAVPFLSVAIVGFMSLGGILYEEVFGLEAAARGTLAAFVEPAGLVGLAVGAKLGTVLFSRDPAHIFRFLRWVTFICAMAVGTFALAPNLAVAVAANVVLSAVLATLLPGLFAVLSLAVPSRARSVGFAVTSWWALPGLFLLPMIGWVADRLGARWGILVMVPVLLVGGWIVASGGSVVARDLADTWGGSLARSRLHEQRRRGEAPLLTVSDLRVAYGDLQVLRGVSLELREGEVIALLGTNGAGKSTLLRALCGLTEADYGAVLYDGVDITHAPPTEIAHAGVSLLAGGRGVFGELTVEENLRVAAWRCRDGGGAVDAARLDEVLAPFPALVERREETAGRLSGGQQQQLALAMALLARPRLLLVDELSLGLAPVVVDRLAVLVREVAASGTAVIVVEQSVNVALTLAERAYFLERGVIRASGPTSGFLDRPDLLRSVFLAEVTPPVEDARPGARHEPRRSDAPVLEVVGATRRFGGVEAVSSVDLTVADGEIVGLIGANGAGKTTLLQMVSGFHRVDGGYIRLEGRDVTNLGVAQRARLGLGRCFQNGRLVPGLTVAQYLALAFDRSTEVRDPFNAALATPAAYDSERRVAERVDALLDRFGIERYRDHFCAELSTGTRRVVDLAAALAHGPRLLLLDEPAAGLAQREVEALVGVLRLLRSELEGSMLIVEHDMPLLAAVCDRLVAMEAGEVIVSGTPDEVLNHPLVLAAYLGGSATATARSGPYVGGAG